MGCRRWGRGGRGGFLGRFSREGRYWGVLVAPTDDCCGWLVGWVICFMHGAGDGGLACEAMELGGYTYR